MSEKPKGGLAEFVAELRREPLRHRIEAAADMLEAYEERMRFCKLYCISITENDFERIHALAAKAMGNGTQGETDA